MIITAIAIMALIRIPHINILVAVAVVIIIAVTVITVAVVVIVNAAAIVQIVLMGLVVQHKVVQWDLLAVNNIKKGGK